MTCKPTDLHVVHLCPDYSVRNILNCSDIYRQYGAQLYARFRLQQLRGSSLQGTNK